MSVETNKTTFVYPSINLALSLGKLNNFKMFYCERYCYFGDGTGMKGKKSVMCFLSYGIVSEKIKISVELHHNADFRRLSLKRIENF